MFRLRAVPVMKMADLRFGMTGPGFCVSLGVGEGAWTCEV